MARLLSPCINVCVIDPGNGFCQGCGRTLAEIARWSGMTDGERVRIMAELALRKQTGGPTKSQVG